MEESVTSGLISAATLITLNVIAAWLTSRSVLEADGKISMLQK